MILKRILPVLIAVALILAIIICGLGIYLKKLEKINLAHHQEIVDEKEAIKKEFEELLVNYDELELNNQDLQQELEFTRVEIDSLYQALSETAPKLSLLRTYRFQIKKLRQEKIRLLKTNDSLVTVNVLMKDSLNLKDSKIKEYFEVKRDLYDQNLALTAEIRDKRKMSFYGTRGDGVKIKKSGKIIITDKVKRIEKIKICTSVRSNSESISESKKVYFKVFNPKNILLGEVITVKHRSKSVFYSFMDQFFYRNQNLDVCKFLEVYEGNLIPGEYTIEVYFDHEIHDITQFTLR